MEALEKLLCKVIRKHASPEKKVTWIVIQKLSEQGIELNDSQVKRLQTSIKHQLNKRSGSVLSLNVEIADKRDVSLSEIILSSDDITSVEQHFDLVIQKVVLSVIESTSDILLNSWREQWAKVQQEDHTQATSFNITLNQKWGKAFDSLEMLLSLSLDLGSQVNRRKRPAAAKNKDFVFDALTRLHARGSQVGREILILLNHGLADGAFARWRTLHEIVVIASFIANHDDDVAERYLLHAIVDDYREMMEFEAHCRTLGYKPIRKKTLKRTTDKYDLLIKQYGNSFKGYFGWAADTLRKNNPQMDDLEKDAGLEFWKPFLQRSHSAIHATAGGINRPLGLPPNSQIMVAGPSVYGIYDPGRTTAYSLTLLTVILLQHSGELEDVSCMKALHSLVKDVYAAFDEVDESDF